MSFCRTLAQFGAKFDVNPLLHFCTLTTTVKRLRINACFKNKLLLQNGSRFIGRAQIYYLPDRSITTFCRVTVLVRLRESLKLIAAPCMPVSQSASQRSSSTAFYFFKND
ncbi:hypothetical protein AVEN_241167-1 [Araneus ventricosus]|uniref:Uncharacterized protein n=1 Tax=Araneus ventricosus TaxID=182803 RepID=A0A4Y2G2Q3_ARAVE|nr:hypothetical protein AVEN_241167-1 [Araneus ventricosus]